MSKDIKNPLLRFFALDEQERLRLAALQDDPDSKYYRKTMTDIMRYELPEDEVSCADAANRHSSHDA